MDLEHIASFSTFCTTCRRMLSFSCKFVYSFDFLIQTGHLTKFQLVFHLLRFLFELKINFSFNFGEKSNAEWCRDKLLHLSCLRYK